MDHLGLYKCMDHLGGAMFSVRKIVSSIPGGVKSKTIKKVLLPLRICLRLDQHEYTYGRLIL